MQHDARGCTDNRVQENVCDAQVLLRDEAPRANSDSQKPQVLWLGGNTVMTSTAAEINVAAASPVYSASGSTITSNSCRCFRRLDTTCSMSVPSSMVHASWFARSRPGFSLCTFMPASRGERSLQHSEIPRSQNSRGEDSSKSCGSTQNQEL